MKYLILILKHRHSVFRPQRPTCFSLTKRHRPTQQEWLPDPQQSAQPGALLPPLLLPFQNADTAKLHHFLRRPHGRQPAGVFHHQSERPTVWLVGRDNRTVLQSVTNSDRPITGQNRMWWILHTHSSERRAGAGRDALNEFWLQESNDLPALWQNQFVLFDCRKV